MLQIGQQAPDIRATDHAGNAFSLSEMRGKKVWLYFYTSPGGRNCTAHACGYRDNLAQFAAKGIEIVGLNDRPASEQKDWVERERLPFRVVSDPEHRAPGQRRRLPRLPPVARKATLFDPARY